MEDLCLHRMPLFQLRPRRVPFLLLRRKQVVVAGRRLRAFGELAVYPVRILARPWHRYLKLVWPAVTVAPIEGLAVNFAGGELVQAIQQPQTCKLTRLGT